MRYCTKCGRQIESQMQFCPHCGAHQPQDTVVQQQNIYTAPVQQPQQPNHTCCDKPKTTDGMCIAGFILSFFIAVLGLLFSIIGYVRVKKDSTKSGSGLAVAGIILSVIWIGIVVLFLFPIPMS